MTKEVETLVIAGHAHMMADTMQGPVRQDVAQGLRYVRNGETTWYNGTPITEVDKNNLFSGEVFLQLGTLASSRYVQQISPSVLVRNPCREAAIRVLDDISPLQPGEKLPSSFFVGDSNATSISQVLPSIFTDILALYPSIEDELLEKWTKAQAVYVARGTTEVMTYDMSSLIAGFRNLKMDEIVPDSVTFDKDLTVYSQSYGVSGLVDRMGLQPRLRRVPYYEMYHDMQTEGAEVLARALEDLRVVSETIKQ